MKDVIRLIGMPFYGYHGVTAAEKETGRIFEVDCELGLDLASAGQSDQLTDTIDYYEVYKIIKDNVEGTAFSLLEGLANRLASIILDKFPIYRVTLKVRKLTPPVAGLAKYIEVEVTRFQGDTDKLTESK
ncbi:MAG: dihydroneopterin aldolase [candidate division Zixibacteria bacterium]|nr:dihydroneopterin aldolase [candidate division Zixibacteria bacterium]MDD5426675.1 dihydroneopterin aldolase [candidate division Zixibacteria bacterium]